MAHENDFEGSDGGPLPDDYDEDELDCTWCGGTGMQENDDPLWYGDVFEVPCEACNGTGLRKHQTVF